MTGGLAVGPSAETELGGRKRCSGVEIARAFSAHLRAIEWGDLARTEWQLAWGATARLAPQRGTSPTAASPHATLGSGGIASLGRAAQSECPSQARSFALL